MLKSSSRRFEPPAWIRRCGLRRLDDFLLAMLVVAVTDVVLFHLGAYFPYLQPASYSGNVERQALRFAGALEAFPGRHRVVVMGNSRTRAAVQVSRLEADLARDGLRYHAINLAIGGLSPRSWFVLLRDGRIAGDNTEIVVLGIGNGAIEASRIEKQRDVEISKTRLRVADAVAMAGAYRGLEERLDVFSKMVFHTSLFRDDLRQFLAAPALRLHQVKDDRARFEETMRAGVRVENRSKDDLLSARLGADNQLVFDELNDFLKRRAGLRRRIEQRLRTRKKILRTMARGRNQVHKMRMDPGKVKLLGRLVEDLNAEGIMVVFSVLPASPYAVNRPMEVDHLDNFFRDLEQRGADVAVWRDPEMLRRLQSPAYYQDTLHMNAEGANIYTRGLARFLVETLASPESKLEVQEGLDAVRGIEDHRPHGERQDRGA